MTAKDLFNALFNASLAVMILSLVTSLGIGMTIRQLLAPLSRVGVLASTVIFNTVLAPLIAIGICDLFPLVEPPIKAGTPDPYTPPKPGDLRPETHLQIGAVIQFVTSLVEAHDDLPQPHTAIEGHNA